MKMSLMTNLQLTILLLTLNLNLSLIMVYGQAQHSPMSLQSTRLIAPVLQSNYPHPVQPQAQSNERKQPLLRSFVSKMQGEDQNSLPTEQDQNPLPVEDNQNRFEMELDPNADPSQQEIRKRPEFFKLLFQRLEERKSHENNSIPIEDKLTLTVNDGSLNAVSIKFVPNSFTPEAEQTWDSIVQLLADSLANVIKEAEQLGYTAKFDYDILLMNALPLAYGPGLSAGFLKSAAG